MSSGFSFRTSARGRPINYELTGIDRAGTAASNLNARDRGSGDSARENVGIQQYTIEYGE
jgi:hypothetical protein